MKDFQRKIEEKYKEKVLNANGRLGLILAYTQRARTYLAVRILDLSRVPVQITLFATEYTLCKTGPEAPVVLALQHPVTYLRSSLDKERNLYKPSCKHLEPFCQRFLHRWTDEWTIGAEFQVSIKIYHTDRLPLDLLPAKSITVFLELKGTYASSLKSLGTLDEQTVSVALGVHNTVNLTDTEVVGVESFLVHPQHQVDEVHDTHDLALLRLSHRINYVAHIQPVCLPTQGEQFSSEWGLIVGWGQTEFNGSKSQNLKQAKVRILEDSLCIQSKMGKHFADSPESMICAYQYKTDACKVIRTSSKCPHREEQGWIQSDTLGGGGITGNLVVYRPG
ncbi:Ovochymase-2 [Homalodisca vitripennis]|nr:Ovochymase-2 [Homalodisca vitripennis]